VFTVADVNQSNAAYSDFEGRHKIVYNMTNCIYTYECECECMCVRACVCVHAFYFTYSRTPLIRINWDGKPPGYAENPDNWIFL
jgi:hypothetical protein